MVNDELVSVIIPIYNVQPYLKRCVDSICGQTYTNIEIILIDDGSPDGCWKICDDYKTKDSRIVVIHQQNQGLSGARNSGINIAKGRYICFVDSDDYIEENMVEVLYSNIKEYKADISCCGHKDIYDSGHYNYNDNIEVDLFTAEEALGIFLYTQKIDVVAWNKMYKKELFNNIRYEEGKLFEDHFTTYKLLDKSDKIVNTTQPLYCYCKRGDSIGGSTFSKKNYQLKEALDVECDYIISRHPNIKEDIKVGYVFWMIVLFDKMILANYNDDKLYKCIKTYIYKYFSCIRKSKYLSKSQKIQMILFYVLHYKLYKILYMAYLKMKR